MPPTFVINPQVDCVQHILSQRDWDDVKHLHLLPQVTAGYQQEQFPAAKSHLESD